MKPKPKLKKDSNPRQEPDGPIVSHAGTELCLVVWSTKKGKKLHIRREDTREEWHILPPEEESFWLFCPSVEGTVLWCRLKSNQEALYDVLKKRWMDKVYMEEVKSKAIKMPAMHFYT